MPEREGFVSLWIGSAATPEALEEYLTFTYDEDGNSSCPFCTDFQVSWFDEDFREAARRTEPTESLMTLLAGVSFEASVVPRFVALLGESLPIPANAFVLLYNHAFEGPVEQVNAGAVRLAFFGVLRYR